MLKSRSDFSRLVCRRSPWIGAARTPFSFSSRARRSAITLVLVNMIVRSADRAMAAATLGLSILWTAMNRWVISSTVTSRPATSCMEGSS